MNASRGLVEGTVRWEKGEIGGYQPKLRQLSGADCRRRSQKREHSPISAVAQHL